MKKKLLALALAALLCALCALPAMGAGGTTMLPTGAIGEWFQEFFTNYPLVAAIFFAFGPWMILLPIFAIGMPIIILIGAFTS